MDRKLGASLVAFAAIAVLLMSLAAGLIQSGSSGITPTTTHRITTTRTGGLQSAVTAGACAQHRIHLGEAGRFRVLAATTVTSTGATVVRGNLGVSPGSSITGFPPGVVTGAIHRTDTLAAQAQKDLKTAFNSAMGRTNCVKSLAGNLGGRTLGPGLYHSTSSLAISSGDLTLTAFGHPNAVFIFQITTKFSTTSGRQVILAGGAEAKNIYWVVGSSATLGTTSVVYGDILAHKSISLATGAKLHGRALANIGAVTLDGNKVAHHVPISRAPSTAAASTGSVQPTIFRLLDS